MPPRPVASLCPFCELRSIFSPQRATKPPTWQQPVRCVSNVQRKKKLPLRMTLSPSVAKGPVLRVMRTDKPHREHIDARGPFGGVNRTTLGPRFEAELRMKQERAARCPVADRPSGMPVDRRKKSERSPGDMKALRMQKMLAPIGYAQRASIKDKIQSIDSFLDFPLLPVVQESIPSEALKGMVNISPTPIQRLAIPALIDTGGAIIEAAPKRTKKFLLAAETGSGKTLAYLLPTIDAIKRADITATESEAQEKEAEKSQQPRGFYELEPPPLSNAPHSTSGRPRAIILVPTSELVDQVGALFKAFSHSVKLRVSLISASYTATVIRNRLFGPSGIDVVVSTPHLLKSIAESEPNILSRVTHLIVDEADSLLDRSFAPLTLAILDRASPSLKQLILCSATIPRSLDSFLQKRFPDIHRLATPNLHAIPRRVQLSVVDVDREPYRGNRDLACADSIWQIGRAAAEQGGNTIQEQAEARRIIVFVNEREKGSKLAEYLITKGVDAVALNRDTVEERRGEILAAFTTASSHPISKDVDGGGAEPLGQNNSAPANEAPRILSNVKVIVMTDIGSRGIDTLAVRNVVLYDVPHTTVDFIHRLGRVGRMGRRGKGLVLVDKHDRKDVVREVREGMFRGQALI